MWRTSFDDVCQFPRISDLVFRIVSAFSMHDLLMRDLNKSLLVLPFLGFTHLRRANKDRNRSAGGILYSISPRQCLRCRSDEKKWPGEVVPREATFRMSFPAYKIYGTRRCATQLFKVGPRKQGTIEFPSKSPSSIFSRVSLPIDRQSWGRVSIVQSPTDRSSVRTRWFSFPAANILDAIAFRRSHS